MPRRAFSLLHYPSDIIVETLKDLKLTYPKVDDEQRTALEKAKKALMG